MANPVSRCPNCGAPVTFQWSGSVQTVCEFCRSVIVRTDLDLRNVGRVADLPPDGSPIQLGTTGRYRDRPFTVGGRIVYTYDQGGWNEWHLNFGDGSDGWLSDAQNEFAISTRVDAPKLPTALEAVLGSEFRLHGATFAVSSRTEAQYAGVEGELPFEYWDKTSALFVDLRSENQDFATLDYSDGAPVLYLGQSLDFDALQLANVRRFEGW
jgi:hypothetical protein